MKIRPLEPPKVALFIGFFYYGQWTVDGRRASEDMF